jgi:hypothetical protein
VNTRRYSSWDIAYAILLVVSIPVLIYYAAKGLWGLILLTIGFLAVGLATVVYSRREGETFGPRFAFERERHERAPRIHRGLERTESGRPYDWLAMAVLSGFAATGVLTTLLLFAYGAADLLGSNAAGASLVSRWLWSLSHNPATRTAQVNLPLALVLNFAAGIAWAVIYAALFEPRLRGSGWRRGALYALLPWLVSIVIALPVMGGGFLGIGLHAGPLPVIGNLLLHLAFGLTLGEVYGSEAVFSEEGEAATALEARELDRSERLIAISLVPGALLGFVVALLGSSVFAPGADPWLIGVFGGIVGSVVGVLVASFVGLGSARTVEPAAPVQATPPR